MWVAGLVVVVGDEDLRSGPPDHVDQPTRRLVDDRPGGSSRDGRSARSRPSPNRDSRASPPRRSRSPRPNARARPVASRPRARFSCSGVRSWNGCPGSRSVGFWRSPSSPPVQHTSTVLTPSAWYFASVGAPLDASSSGWACTVRMVRGSDIPDHATGRYARSRCVHASAQPCPSVDRVACRSGPRRRSVRRPLRQDARRSGVPAPGHDDGGLHDGPAADRHRRRSADAGRALGRRGRDPGAAHLRRRRRVTGADMVERAARCRRAGRHRRRPRRRSVRALDRLRASAPAKRDWSRASCPTGCSSGRTRRGSPAGRSRVPRLGKRTGTSSRSTRSTNSSKLPMTLQQPKCCPS